MASSYNYQDLISSGDVLNVRILVLDSGAEDDEVSCNLEVTPLHTAKQSFEALSYTWGSSSNSQRIRIGSDYTLIGENLFQALRHLRLEHGTRRLWADAFCINQADEAEKTSQVASMGEIYQAAIRTVVWLGDESPAKDFELAKSFFQWLVPVFEARYPTARDPRRTYLKPPSSDSYVDIVGVIQSFNSENNRQDHGSLTLPTLQAFYNRPWFSRRWVLQEIHNAREVLMQCGKQTMPWKLFQDAMDLPLDIKTGHWMPQTISAIHGRLDVSLVDVLQTLETYHPFQCVDNRDRLSTLLNFKAYRLLTDHYGLFKVDYQRTVEHNYLEFAKSLVDQGRVLSLLVHTTKRRTTYHLEQIISGSSLPSWVPDWRVSPIAPAHALDFYGYPAVVEHDNALTLPARITNRITSDIDKCRWEHNLAPNNMAPQNNDIFGPELAAEAPKPRDEDVVCEFTMYDGSRGPCFVLRKIPARDCFLLVCECMPLHLAAMNCFEELPDHDSVVDIRIA